MTSNPDACHFVGEDTCPRRQAPVKTRPICPLCGRELVQAVIILNTITFNVYLCDCQPQPPNVAGDIAGAREWDNVPLVFTIEPCLDQDDFDEAIP